MIRLIDVIVFELKMANIKLQAKNVIDVPTNGLATNERVVQLETALVREFSNKLLIYSIGIVVATVVSLVVLFQYLIK